MEAAPSSPLRKRISKQIQDPTSEAYQTASKKLTEAAWNYSSSDGTFLKTLELRQIDPEVFRKRIRTGLNCFLTKAELAALLPLFENDGCVDGFEFVITFFHLRFEYKGMVDRKLVEHNRRYAQAAADEVAKHQEKFTEKYAVKLRKSTTEEDLQTAIEKLADAAYKYDRMAPGAIPLDAFNCESMRPEEFRNQLKILFNVKVSVRELSALVHHLNGGTDDDNVPCASFVIFFVRLGFDERSRKNQERWDMERRRKEHDEKKKQAEAEKQEKKQALKVKANFAPTDLNTAMDKLRDAARIYDIQVDQKRSLRAFTSAFMPPHIFKDQLKINFNVVPTPGELGALVDKFNDGSGNVVCATFTKQFLTLMLEERDREVRERNERDKKAEEDHKADLLRKEQEQAARNAKKINFKYGEEDMVTALQKLAEAAHRFDRNMPGAPSLATFASTSITAFDFKEQLKRLFNMQVTPRELGALMSFFNADEEGNISCSLFLMRFLKMGFEEKQKRQAEYRKHEAEVADLRAKEEAAKAKSAEDKLAVRVKGYSEADFESAMEKLTEAAFLYDRSNPGAMGLKGFENESMPPHMFREQIKRVFNLSVTKGELGALVSYFDKAESGVVNCKVFIDRFLRMGMLERDRVYRMQRDEQKAKEEKEAAKRRARDEEERQRAMRAINFDFSETDFDAAVARFVATCHHFDPRTLGPMGWSSITADKLPFAEFKTLLKLQFQLKFAPAELGALVMFVDPSFQAKGHVSCRTFINVFLQTKLQCEGFKNRPDEAALIKAYQVQLKSVFQQKLERVKARAEREGSDGSTTLKPWRVAPLVRRASSASPTRASTMESVFTSASQPGAAAGAAARGRGNVVAAVKRAKLPRPHDPVQKLKLRLTVGRDTGRMDLSTKICWPDADDASAPRRRALFQRSQESVFMERSVEYGLSGGPRAVVSQSRAMSRKHSRSVTPHATTREDAADLEPAAAVPTGMGAPRVVPPDLAQSNKVFAAASEVFGTDSGGSAELGTMGVGDAAFDSPPLTLVGGALGVDSLSGSGVDMGAYLGRDFHADRQPSASTVLTGGGLGVEESKSELKVLNYSIPEVHNGFSFALAPGGSLTLLPLDPPAAPAPPSTTKKKKGSGSAELEEGSSVAKSIASKHAEERRVAGHLALGARLEAGFSVEFTLAAVPTQVFHFTHLTELWLDNNLISAVPAEIGRLTELKVLSLSGNFIDAVPDEVCTLAGLERLYLARNRLAALPSTTFQFLGSLLELHLQENEFTVFPDEVCAIARLQHLDMSGNAITTLPASLRVLKNLVTLFLWDTAITQPPPVLTALTNRCTVVGCPMPLPDGTGVRLPTLYPDVDDGEMENFLRNRASSRIAARLRRRRKSTAVKVTT